MSAFLDYIGLPGVNWSTLKHMLRSPLHYRHVLQHGTEDTTSRLLGRALHAALLEPDVFASEYVVFDGDRRGGPWKTFQEANPGRPILRAVERAKTDAQAAAVRAHPVAGPLVAGALGREAPIRWVDPETGIACKGLIDIISDGPSIYDLKGGPSLDQVERWIIREGYHLQLAYYRRGMRVLIGEQVPCGIIAVEREAPHDVGAFALDEGLLTLADRELDRLLLTLAACRESGRWPGRYPDTQQVEAPSWMLDPENMLPTEGFGEVDLEF